MARREAKDGGAKFREAVDQVQNVAHPKVLKSTATRWALRRLLHFLLLCVHLCVWVHLC